MSKNSQQPLAIETKIASETENEALNKQISELPKIQYHQINVLTTELVAQFFGCENIHIQQNFTNNKTRFELEKHYFELSGNELKEFKNQLVNLGYSILSSKLKFAPKLTLWTKQGTLLLAKILDTDQAWNVIDELVKFYFNAKKEESKSQKYSEQFYKKSNPKYLAPIQDALAVAESIAKILRVSDSSYINMTTTICNNYDVNPNFLPEYIEQHPVSSLSKLLEEFNLTHLWTAQKLNLILEEHGILEKITRKSTKSQDKLKSFWSLTSKGLEWGKNEVYSPNPRETQPLYFRDKFMSLLKQLQIV